ncbi:MAG: transposase [Desulfobacterales bacterium]|uniref:Transposase n=1 Tax=Candidatus Desulfatibia vada TaxID=2841696 RepID=A0A8J6NW00_9BACT|nr:transposase [Candidatus Desulfatibia vada]
MPRKARIDAPGALHHIICRGIENGDIFTDNADRNNFLDRLGNILSETKTPCFAWALIPNHFHLLLRTANVPIATVMKRLLTGYAVSFNRRHHRSGHLFQNRYKSILCQEDLYLMELVRYIHLNPLRANLVSKMNQLNRYPYSGHSTLTGYKKKPWQDVEYVLSLFGKRVSTCRKKYRRFVEKGIEQGRQPGLTGGGLVRSSGGWGVLKSMRRMGVHLKGDERILGDSDFVESSLKTANEAMERKYQLQAAGYDFDKVVDRVAELFQLKHTEIVLPSKQHHRVKARSLLCFWTVRELGMSSLTIAGRLGITQPAVSRLAQRGEKLAIENSLSLEN